MIIILYDNCIELKIKEKKNEKKRKNFILKTDNKKYKNLLKIRNFKKKNFFKKSHKKTNLYINQYFFKIIINL